MSLTLLFTLYLGKIRIPLPAWSTERHCHVIGYPLFQLFPVQKFSFAVLTFT